MFSEILQVLLDQGAQKFAVVGVPPLGCFPAAITIYSRNPKNALLQRNCLETFNSIARDFNSRLQNKLRTRQRNLSSNYNAKIVYIDLFQPLLSIIQDHKKYGFHEAKKGCCGTGLSEESFLGNAESPVCPNASKCVFWDVTHPSDKTYSLISKGIIPTIEYTTSE